MLTGRNRRPPSFSVTVDVLGVALAFALAVLVPLGAGGSLCEFEYTMMHATTNRNEMDNNAQVLIAVK